MKLPGDAWLEFAINEDGDQPILEQRALFIPHGLAGDLYWWVISPFHNIVFGSMIKNIAAGIPPRATPAVAPGRREG